MSNAVLGIDARVEIADYWRAAAAGDGSPRTCVRGSSGLQAADPLAMLREIGPRIRGVASHGMAGMPRAQIDLMPNLEICAINGVGLETTDLATCKERGIVVTIAPVLYDDVADLAVALALATCRKIPAGDRFVRDGSWQGGSRMELGRKLTGMRARNSGSGTDRRARSLSGWPPSRRPSATTTR